MKPKFGSQYESQFRQPRREGFQQTTAMDNLYKILGIGGQIADRVQKGRNESGNVHRIRMESLLDVDKTGMPFYARTNDNTLIEEFMGDFVNNVGKTVNNTDAETKEIYNAHINRMKKAMQDNTEYQAATTTLFDLEEQFKTDYEDYYNNQDAFLNDKNLKDAKVEKLTKTMNAFSKARIALNQRFRSKLAYDTDAKNSFISMNLFSKRAIADLNNNRHVSPKMIEHMIRAIDYNDMQSVAKIDNNYDNIEKSQTNAIIDNIKTYKNENSVYKLNNANLSGTKETNESIAAIRSNEENIELNKGLLDIEYDKFYNQTGSYYIDDSRNPQSKKTIDDFSGDAQKWINDNKEAYQDNELLGNAYDSFVDDYPGITTEIKNKAKERFKSAINQ